ncbi:hypothetical protein J2127_000690 [Methanococcus voltae]|uniref:hypothetical protein n=1 Tax=Methanococcus voltae TaxID=2188 RepID=UPI001AE6BAEC|nr:hypothetical protein [Methanococcus voltae]MBP2143535.1 hypothetical protein [Methanococcus voltae]
MKHKLFLILSLSCMLMFSGCIGVTVCSDEVLDVNGNVNHDSKDISKNNGKKIESNARTSNSQFKIV